MELLGYGLSVRKIAEVLGYSSHIALNTYINKRGLQPLIKKVGLDSCDFAKKLS